MASSWSSRRSARRAGWSPRCSPTSPARSTSRCTRRTTRSSPPASRRSTTPTWRSAGTTPSRPFRRCIRVVDGQELERTVGWSRADWQRVTGLDGLGEDLPVMRPGCGSLSVDPDRVDELRVRFEGGRLRSRRVELAELEDDIEAMFTRGWTDGLPVVPPTESRVLRHARGDDAGAGRDRRHRAAGPRRDHGREGGHRRRDGGLPARVPAVGADRRGGDLHRRVQHPRRPGDDDAGRAGDHRQRTGHPSDRDERWRQRPRAGQPRQPDDRPGGAARRAQRRRRPPGRRRSGRPRQPGQAVVLLQRAARLAVRHARREPRRGARRRRRHGVRR